MFMLHSAEEKVPRRAWFFFLVAMTGVPEA
jgi:hypothetical protein